MLWGYHIKIILSDINTFRKISLRKIQKQVSAIMLSVESKILSVSLSTNIKIWCSLIKILRETMKILKLECKGHGNC